MAEGELLSLRLLVTGRVQGVGYRFFTQRLAEQLGLVGWVRNLRDGSVEIEVAGSKTELERFKSGLRRGPSGSRVAGVHDEQLATPPSADHFSIVY